MVPSPVKALVFVKALSVPFEEIFKALKKYPEIKEAWAVTGDIDLVLHVEARDTKELFELIKRLRSEAWCMQTKTSIILASYP